MAFPPAWFTWFPDLFFILIPLISKQKDMEKKGKNRNFEENFVSL